MNQPMCKKYDRIQLWWDDDNDPSCPGWCITSWRDGAVRDHDILVTDDGDDLPEDSSDETVKMAAKRYLGPAYEETIIEIDR